MASDMEVDFIKFWIKTEINLSASSDYRGESRYFQNSMIKLNIRKLNLRPDDAVLDVGCGTGEGTKSIATTVRSTTGIDTSEEMLAFARTNNPGPSVTYSFGDAQTVGDSPEHREGYNKAVSFFVLHWCPDHAKALRSILACIKPGGQGLFIVVNRELLISEANLFITSHARWGNYVKGFKTSNSFWNRSVAETEELLAACGWTNAQCEIQHFWSSTELRTKLYLITSLGISERIPETEREAYLDDLWQWALSRYKDATQAGHVILPIELMVVHACKPL